MLIEHYQAAIAALAPLGSGGGGIGHHPYAHPTEAGRARDHCNR